MKLVVPAVLDEGFLDAMAAPPISHLYGTLGGDVGLREKHCANIALGESANEPSASPA